MRKIISVMLISTMLMTISIPSFAMESSIIEMETPIIFVYNGHGEFTVSNENIIVKNNNYDQLSVGEKIVAVPTEDEEYFKD